MLRIYPVSLEMVKSVRGLCDAIAVHDSDLARQLRRASMSVVLNIAEGSAARNGKRRNRYEDALGSAREVVAGLQAAEAVGYLHAMPRDVANRFDHIIGTLCKLVR